MKKVNQMQEVTPVITEEQIKLVMRQTMYDEVKANEKLVYFKGDVIKVLRDYMSIPEPVEPVVKSVNQTIYKELRKNLGIVEIVP
jgi:hypothetical protein